jgi:hypothetical protein
VPYDAKAMHPMQVLPCTQEIWLTVSILSLWKSFHHIHTQAQTKINLIMADAVWTSVRKEVEDGIQQGHSQYHTYSDVPLYGVIGNQ